MNLGVNTRIFQLKDSVITDLPEQLKYLRAFGVDFKKPIGPDGLLQKPDPARIDAFVRLATSRNLKVIWVPQITKDGRSIPSEFAFIQDLMNRGVQFHAFQILGEFYLPKYYYGDTNAKGVIEQIRKEDLPDILDLWVPAIRASFPDQKTFITCASHQGGTNVSEKYRRQYTDVILKWSEVRNYEGEFCFHMYAGYKGQDGGNEEKVYTEIDFSYIVDQIEEKFPDTLIHLCEGGYYRKDNTEFPKMGEFVTTAYNQLGSHAIIALQLLQGSDEFAWFDGQGMTDTGEYMINVFFKNLNTSEPQEPFLEEFWENPYYSFLLGTTYSQGLRFSDGSFYFNTAREKWGKMRGYRVTESDIDKPFSYFRDKIKSK